jgi:hypothetical protein
MSSPVPLKKDKHAKLKVIQSGDFTRFKDKHLIPIVNQDFFALQAEFPVVFVKNQQTGEFIPVAVMGLREGQNLYCQTKEWKAHVIPMSFGNAPLVIARADPEGEQYIVLVEEDSPMLSETEGEALFTASGEKTEFLERKVDIMLNIAQQSVQTQAVCKQLADMNLLMTQVVQLRHRPDSKMYNIDGIYTVNEDALNKLSEADFLLLRSNGILPLIYAHLSSLQQLRRISMLQYEADKAAGELIKPAVA